LKTAARNAHESLRTAIFDLTPTVPDLNQVFEGPDGIEGLVNRFSEEFSLHVSYSTSKRACVGVCVGRGVLRLTVYDEGYLNEDLETTAVEAHGHGLNLMRARAHLLGGDVWLEQLAAGGTALTLEVPI
jgi:signal transduction histidine kinase